MISPLQFNNNNNNKHSGWQDGLVDESTYYGPDLSVVPGIHMVGGENQLQQTGLYLHRHHGAYTS